MSCSRKDRMTGNQLYEANHLYSMNSNNYREICKKPTTSKRHSKQRRPLILACEKVPICAARWCSLCKNITHSKTINQGKHYKNTKVKWIFATNFRLTRDKFKPIAPKPLLFSFLLRNQNKRIQVLTILTQLSRQMVRMPQFFRSDHHYLMKAITYAIQYPAST